MTETVATPPCANRLRKNYVEGKTANAFNTNNLIIGRIVNRKRMTICVSSGAVNGGGVVCAPTDVRCDVYDKILQTI